MLHIKDGESKEIKERLCIELYQSNLNEETPLRCYLTMEVPIKLKKNVLYNSYMLHRFECFTMKK